jgi:hypothetical protein
MSLIFNVAFVLGLICVPRQGDNTRNFTFDGVEMKTTFSSDKKFLGRYQGKKTGYLLLNEDGTGEYNYDIFGMAPKSCKPSVITFEWGFLLDQNYEIVRFERDYGYSYPILYRSTGEISFQGCSKVVFMDYILVYNNGEIHVSSSDDWVKR